MRGGCIASMNANYFEPFKMCIFNVIYYIIFLNPRYHSFHIQLRTNGRIVRANERYNSSGIFPFPKFIASIYLMYVNND